MLAKGKVPCRVILEGDVEAAKDLRGFAIEEMESLENYMRSKGLKQWKSQTVLGGGVIIQCRSIFALQDIRIIVPVQGEPVIQIEKECWCCCFYSTGVVKNFTDEENGYGDKEMLYDVAVCQGKEYYVYFRNCLSTDFAMYTHLAVDQEKYPDIPRKEELVFVFLHVDPPEGCCDTIYKDWACNQKAPLPEDINIVFRIVPFWVRRLEEWMVDND